MRKSKDSVCGVTDNETQEGTKNALPKDGGQELLHNNFPSRDPDKDAKAAVDERKGNAVITPGFRGEK